MPPSLEINRPYLQLYGFCSDQLIIGSGGAVGINLLAVDKAMDYFEVDMDERAHFFNQVRTITSIVLSEQYKEQEQQRQTKKGTGQ